MLLVITIKPFIKLHQNEAEKTMSGHKGDTILHKTFIAISTRTKKLKAPQHSRLK